jgi:two-component system, OmpR family, copper resistance phosphate regulon response regulator CusR
MGMQSILIVEDEQRLAKTLAQGLQETGYVTTVAADGAEAWAIFSSASFDLILLDVNLPKRSGYKLCELIRGVKPELPVIMLTAMRQLEDKQKGYEAGADDYLVKPFEFSELLMKIKAILRRSCLRVMPATEVLSVADLKLDLGLMEATREGKPIKLTAKEFQLLEFLVRNTNRVLSRADIAQQVWEIDFDTNTNYIDVYISYLRNKVDKPFAQKLIHTQVGIGYVLRELPIAP